MASSSSETEFIYDVTIPEFDLGFTGNYKQCDIVPKQSYKCKKVPVDDYFKYVTSNDRTLVLFSPGFGSGWSTWNGPGYEQLIFDTRIIDYITNEKTKDRLANLSKDMSQDDVEIKQLMETVFGKNSIYLGGFLQLTIATIPIGTMFRIREYDGSESIEIFDKRKYYTA